MKKLTVLIQSLFLVLFLSQCKVDKTFITDAEKSWFRCYKTGDILIFSNGQSKRSFIVDTIFASNPMNDNPYDWEGLSWFYYFEVSDQINGTGMIRLIPYPVKSKPNKYKKWDKWAYMSISNERDWIHGGLFMYVGDLTFSDSEIYSSEIKPHVTENGDYIFIASKFTTKDPRDSVTDFVWSKNRGLLSFTIRDSTVYHLIERIPVDSITTYSYF